MSRLPDRIVPCDCTCHDKPGVRHCFPCCDQCYEQRWLPHPDRPPPHPTSPFRWTWDDRPEPEPPSSWFDLSRVYAAADRVLWRPE